MRRLKNLAFMVAPLSMERARESRQAAAFAQPMGEGGQRPPLLERAARRGSHGLRRDAAAT